MTSHASFTFGGYKPDSPIVDCHFIILCFALQAFCEQTKAASAFPLDYRERTWYQRKFPDLDPSTDSSIVYLHLLFRYFVLYYRCLSFYLAKPHCHFRHLGSSWVREWVSETPNQLKFDLDRVSKRFNVFLVWKQSQRFRWQRRGGHVGFQTKNLS